MKRILKITVPGLVALFALAGCSSNEENPITPDRMNEIRKKEADERANLSKQGGPPPATPNGK